MGLPHPSCTFIRFTSALARSPLPQPEVVATRKARSALAPGRGYCGIHGRMCVRMDEPAMLPHDLLLSAHCSSTRGLLALAPRCPSAALDDQHACAEPSAAGRAHGQNGNRGAARLRMVPSLSAAWGACARQDGRRHWYVRYRTLYRTAGPTPCSGLVTSERIARHDGYDGGRVLGRNQVRSCRPGAPWRPPS